VALSVLPASITETKTAGTAKRLARLSGEATY